LARALEAVNSPAAIAPHVRKTLLNRLFNLARSFLGAPGKADQSLRLVGNFDLVNLYEVGTLNNSRIAEFD
jgi:hypothetical protein